MLYSLGYNDGLVLGCNEYTKLGLSDGEVYGIKHWFHDGLELGSSGG